MRDWATESRRLLQVLSVTMLPDKFPARHFGPVDGSSSSFWKPGASSVRLQTWLKRAGDMA